MSERPAKKVDRVKEKMALKAEAKKELDQSSDDDHIGGRFFHDWETAELEIFQSDNEEVYLSEYDEKRINDDSPIKEIELQRKSSTSSAVSNAPEKVAPASYDLKSLEERLTVMLKETPISEVPEGPLANKAFVVDYTGNSVQILRD